MKKKALKLEDVAHIGALSSLSIKEEELGKYTAQLNEILSFFEKLQAIDTQNVLPLTQVVSAAGQLREDKVEASLPFSDWSCIAPKKKDYFFLVPPVFREE